MSQECCEVAGYGGRAAGVDDASRLTALRLARTGEVLELGHTLRPGAPHFAGVQPPFVMNLWNTAQGVIRSLRRRGVVNDAGFNLEHVSMTFHVGTHVDALGHFSAGERMYAGRDSDRTVGDLGLYELGAEAIPAIVARGVLLDVARFGSAGALIGGEAVTRAMLERAEAAAGTTLRPGDVALIRTGWGALYGDDPATYVRSEPGLDLEAARYLTSKGVIAIGADNMAVEVMPGTDSTISMPVHQHTLVDCGVYLIENMALDALAESGRREVCFLLLTPRIRGATGSLARPIALL